MAIIRNERPKRPEPKPAEPVQAAEEEMDYSWHPSEEEFSSPLTAQQWAELLGDATFGQSDAARAVRCLHEYGEPATFQQLSIRYRGTMGRYRRWLGEAAQAAGTRFGVDAPGKDQFGMDEWWQLLYVTRATGKPGAGVFEMQLRPEVQEAFKLIAEQERQAKRAENARQLQRIEQLERARKEESERHAAAAKAQETTIATQAGRQEAPFALAESQTSAVTPTQPATDEKSNDSTSEPAAPQEELVPTFPALNEFLDLVAGPNTAGGTRYVPGEGSGAATTPFDAAGPLDYALRYADRLRSVLALMCEAAPGITAAAVARTLGDESVEELQEILNGQAIPAFSYLDRLKEQLFISPAYLEAAEGTQEDTPAFCTYDELLREHDARANLNEDKPSQIAYLVDDSPSRRTGVVLRFGALRCTLLTRVPVDSQTTGTKSAELDAFIQMVGELDNFAQANGIARTSHTIGTDDWDKVVSGRMWPAALL